MTKISSEKIKLLHQLMAEATGGSIGLRDEGLLDSAVEGAFATFDGVELYPSKEEKAAKLGYSLVSNHAFVDGNKRIGVYVMISFLELNGIHIDSSDEDIIALGLGVADGSMSQDDVLKWIYAHRI
ncbi:MAG: type II toxin-antitoxin system death-on-curing family toxin [Mogibacterium sp.]|nr:type II toxin-antitoxin system death-on-curing family toxin [Mogibacterium sp.]MBR4090927.1 type II toxin-antitoxin system death-on-curing family toxin [Mogibacterium sp.]